MRIQMIKYSSWLDAVCCVSLHTEHQVNLKFAVMKWAMCDQAGRKAKNEKRENETFASGKLLLCYNTALALRWSSAAPSAPNPFSEAPRDLACLHGRTMQTPRCHCHNFREFPC
jgi:hypothetical protein